MSEPVKHATESESAMMAVLHKCATQRQRRIARFGWDKRTLKLLDERKVTLTQAEFFSDMLEPKKSEALRRLEAGELAKHVIVDYQRKKRKPRKTKTTVTDGNGALVPERLVEEFEAELARGLADEIRGWLRNIRDVRITLKDIGNPWMNQGRIAELIDAAKSNLSAAIDQLVDSNPYMLCPACGGVGCDECRVRCGWVPEWRWREIQAEKGDA